MNSNKHHGFTLIELIVTLTIMGIITAIALPYIFTYLANMEAKRVRYSAINVLTSAKAESLIRRQNMVVCLSDGSGICHKDSNKSLLLFMDKNGDNNFNVETDILIEEQRLNPKYGTLHLRAGKRHYIRFAGDSGRPRGFFGHIKYCSSSIYSVSKYKISFNQAGIIKYKPDSKKEKTDCPS